jgi:hypothetical protein
MDVDIGWGVRVSMNIHTTLTLETVDTHTRSHTHFTHTVTHTHTHIHKHTYIPNSILSSRERATSREAKEEGRPGRRRDWARMRSVGGLCEDGGGWWVESEMKKWHTLILHYFTATSVPATAPHDGAQSHTLHTLVLPSMSSTMGMADPNVLASSCFLVSRRLWSWVDWITDTGCTCGRGWWGGGRVCTQVRYTLSKHTHILIIHIHMNYIHVCMATHRVQKFVLERVLHCVQGLSGVALDGYCSSRHDLCAMCGASERRMDAVT